MIYLHMSGGPPHLDIFDYKPELVKHNGQDAPDAIHQRQEVCVHHRRSEADGHAADVQTVRQEWHWMSDAIPNFQTIADEMCVIKSMNTDQFNHAPAELLLVHGLAAAGPAIDGVVGRRTAWVRRMKICRASWC